MNLNHLLRTLLLYFACGKQWCYGCHHNNICNKYTLELGNVYPICYLKDDEHILFCRGGFDGKWEYGSRFVRILIICEWPESSFNPQNILYRFPLLRELTIANSNLTKLTTSFLNNTQDLEKIVIINTSLRQLPKDCFKNLSALRSLDLRNNNLYTLNPEDINTPSLKYVHLFGNPWRCDISTAWILDASNKSLACKILDKHRLQCSLPYEGRPLVPVIEVITVLERECKKTVCKCELVYVVGKAGRQTQRHLMAFATMNCSYRGLTEMPAYLPANISSVHLIGNQITDLSPLKTNHFYKRILDLYLDNNLIESLSILDGTYWLEHFRLLSLRGNKLTDLPTYALENSLLFNTNAASLYLGNNPWRCDCLFTPGFQEMLIRYPKLVKDIDDVKCSSTEHDKNSNKQIRDLTRTEICMSSGEFLDPMDILNIVLVSLILIILGKFLYDYRMYKKSGKLPCIVNYIP